MKHCPKCGQLKTLDNFRIHKGRHQSWCNPCTDASSIISKKNRIARRRRWIDKYKLSKGCLNCGFDKSSVSLDWHHINEKDKNHGIAHMFDHSLRRLFCELRKCVILCANCHRMLHSNELDLNLTDKISQK
jgi:hypothetical protein